MVTGLSRYFETSFPPELRFMCGREAANVPQRKFLADLLKTETDKQYLNGKYDQ